MKQEWAGLWAETVTRSQGSEGGSNQDVLAADVNQPGCGHRNWLAQAFPRPCVAGDRSIVTALGNSSSIMCAVRGPDTRP